MTETRSMTTMLLKRMASGDAAAADELFPMLYGELHSLARGYMAGERRHHTLQPTALIHEAWLRLLGPDPQSFHNRGHFVGVAARAMRRVLIDHARKRGADKRGGEADRLPLDVALDLFEDSGPDLLVLDEALVRLASFDPELSRMVELRYFGGVSAAEIAQGLGVSTRTVERGLKTAQAWLRAELDPEEENPGSPVAGPGETTP